jgi:hypothetical protein
VVYKAGKTNKNADALSWNPVREDNIKILAVETHSDSSSDDELIFEARFRITMNTENPTKNIASPAISPPSDKTIDDRPETLESNLSSNNYNVTSPDDRTPDNGNVSDENNNSDNNDDVTYDNNNNDDRDDDAATSISNSDIQSDIFNAETAQYERKGPEFIYVRDNFLTRKDNLVIFVTQKGKACDDGSRILINETRKENFSNGILGRAKIVMQNKKRIIALTVKEQYEQTTDADIFKQCFHSLVDAVTELQLNRISICNK